MRHLAQIVGLMLLLAISSQQGGFTISSPSVDPQALSVSMNAQTMGVDATRLAAGESARASVKVSPGALTPSHPMVAEQPKFRLQEPGVYTVPRRGIVQPDSWSPSPSESGYVIVPAVVDALFLGCIRGNSGFGNQQFAASGCASFDCNGASRRCEFATRAGERARIARELHDSLLQSFQAPLYTVQAVNNLLPSTPKIAAQMLERSLERADGRAHRGARGN